MLKHSKIPLWVSALMVVLLAFMSIQVYWFYFDHQSLRETGISITGVPDLNIIYTTAGRLLAMMAATVFVIITQNPHQYLVVLLMSIWRDGQEMFIDPLYPYANSPSAPLADFGIHLIIVALEVTAFIVVYKLTQTPATEAAQQ
ncbi:MAG: hypothetical protein AAF404_02880 [Pseudomonadota bacterium]